jgi:predicted GNAT family acetyltransferase
MSTVAATVVDNKAADRYELLLEGERVGELLYRAHDDFLTLIHTEVDPRFEGRGLADHLVTSALDDIRERGLQIVPICPYVAAFMGRHPEYESLVRRRYR